MKQSVTTCITCNITILSFPLSFHASNFISILDYLSYLYSNYNGGIETKSKTKDAPSLCEFLCCSKNKVWRFANRVVVEGDAWASPSLWCWPFLNISCLVQRGCWGIPKLMVFTNPWMILSLVFLHSLWKNFNTKILPFFFCGVALVA